MKSILFVGGAGFIGFHLTRYFLEKYSDYRIIHLDKLLFSGCLDNVHECQKIPHYFFEHGDASTTQRVVNLFQKFDIRGVVILSSADLADSSFKNPRPLIDSNFLSVFTVLEVARNHWQSSAGIYKLGYDDCRIHYVSSTDVYGQQSEEGEVTEKNLLCPQTPYAASKASAEMFLKSYVNTYNMNISISRLSRVYGPRQLEGCFIPTMITRALKGKNLSLNDDGATKYDWLYIDDVVRALDLIYHKAQSGSVYNVASQKVYTDLEMLRAICAILDIKKPRLNGQKYEQLIRLSTGKRECLCSAGFDLTHIKRDMNWHAVERFETGLVKTVASYIK